MTSLACSTVDIPSRIVRELYATVTGERRLRYTLTYSEGTTVSGLKVLDMAIYPHV